jgi:hypothetical protein
MKYSTSLLAIFLIFCSTVLAQNKKSDLIDKDKSTFENNVFNKQFDETQDTTDANRKLYDLIPEQLPDWVFDIPELDHQIKVVGFSDPNMKKDEAVKQAVLRAKALFALLKYSAVSNITDDYTNLRGSNKSSLYETKFQDFTMAKAAIAYNNSDISVKDTFFTKYNEAIVLLNFKYDFNSDENKDTLVVKGENLQIDIEKNFRTEKIEFFNFSALDNMENDSSDLISQYNYRTVNRGYDISSIMGNKEIEFIERTYNYVTNLDFSKDSTDIEYNTFRLNRGLWNAYISGILSNISVISKDLSSKVKNSNDFYTLKTEGLIRTVARNKVSFGFNNFKMYDNQFYIDLNGQIEPK